MKRPLATLTLLYAAGIVCGAESHLPLLTLFATAFAVLALSFVIKSARVPLILLLMFVVGWLNSALRTEIISPNDLRVHLGSQPELVSVRGEICGAVSRREYEQDGKEGSRTLAQVEVTSLRRKNREWQSATGKVMVNTHAALDETFYSGQPVEIQGVLRIPDQPIARSLFDYKTFLARQGIFFQLDAKFADDWRLLREARTTPPLTQRFLTWSQKTLQRGLPEEDMPLRLIWAMTLGWKPALTDEVSEPFMRSGTMHIFAISGLHVALISAILIALLRALRVPRGICGFIVIPLLWFYTVATGSQPSAIRSTIMMTIVIAGWSLKRPGDLLNSLGAAAFIILLWDPLQLFQAGFQLSFFVVLSIALLTPAFETIRERVTGHDPLLPDELRSKWHRGLDVPVRFISINFVTSLAAWLGSMPLVAFYFHLFTPVSLIANMVIVPLSTLALMSNLGSLICHLLMLPFAENFNHAGWFFMRLMVDASDLFAQAPAAFMHVRTPSILECAVFYTVIFTTAAGWLLLPRRRIWAAAALAVLLGGWFWQWNAERKIWRVTILPLAGGEAVFVDAPHASGRLLIDCGDEKSTHFVTKPFLRSHGVNRLPALLLTHGDLKNIGGTSNILADFRTEKVITSPARFRSQTYRALQSWLDSAKMKNEVKAGDQFGVWTVLHPKAADKFSKADDGPVVLRGKIGGTTILLLSDLSRAGQNLLWERNEDLRADVVVAGLPGDSEPLKDALLEKIAPRLIVITDSQYPATERATPELKQRLRKQGVPVIFCREAGSVTLSCSRKGFSWSTAREAE